MIETSAGRATRLHEVCVYVFLLTLATLLISCGPKPATQPPSPAISRPAQTGAVPTELIAKPSHKRIDLLWKTNRSENTVISGYNIYLWNERDDSVSINDGFRLINPEPYPGDTDGDISSESYPVDGIDNGVIYRVCVTTVYADGSESSRSNVAEAIPRPEGSFTLRESYQGDDSGFSFRTTNSVPTDDLSNDIYLASISGALWVASPQRINVVLRQTNFYSIANDISFDATGPIPLSGNPATTLRISNGSVFVLQDQDNCYALLRVDSVDPKAKIANISFIYQPRPESLIFR